MLSRRHAPGLQNQVDWGHPAAGSLKMVWFLWALMLVAHGAYSRWAQSRSRYALASIFSDVLMIAIGLLTLDQLLKLGIADIVRVGLFFAVFGYCGREFMNAVIGHPSKAR